MRAQDFVAQPIHRLLMERFNVAAEDAVVEVILPAFDGGIDRVHHYTSVDAAESILGSGHIRATHYQYCNDSQEGHYARSLLQSIFGGERRRIGQRPESYWTVRRRRRDFRDLRAWLLYAAIDQMPTLRTHPSIACFSRADGDSLQWRDYGVGGSGCMLSLPIEAFRPPCWGNGPMYKAFPVTYDRRTQRQIMEAILSTVLVETTRLMKTHERLVELEHLFVIAAGHLALWFWAFGAFCKSDRWKSEREIRLLALVDGDLPSDHAPSPFRMTPAGKPYVDLNLPNPADIHVTLGPAVKASDAERITQAIARSPLSRVTLHSTP